jgi:protein ImuA
MNLSLPLPPLAATPHIPATGLQAGCVHELRAQAGTAAHAVFAVLLLASWTDKRPILWVEQNAATYPPGLAWLGLDPARILFATAADDAACLGSLEVALRGGMAGVGACRTLTRLAARRLALAARDGGSIGFLLRHAAAQTSTDSTAFATRWMISPAPSGMAGNRLQAELLYAKGGRPGVFFYDIKEADHDATPPALALVTRGAEPHKQSRAEPREQRRAG